MKTLFALLLLIVVLSSCNKDGFKKSGLTIERTGAIHISLPLSSNQVYITSGLVFDYYSSLNSRKIIKIASSAEADSSLVLFGSSSLQSQTISSYFEEVDFNSHTIFVVLLNYYSQEAIIEKKTDLLVNDETEEFKFDFNLRTKGGGFGMNHLSTLYFFKILINKANYSFSGLMFVKEVGFGSGDGEWDLEYTQ